MLNINQLSFWYKRYELPIVYQCDLSLNKNEFITIVGESGGGKTTLLRLACGLLQLQCIKYPEYEYLVEGKVTFNGNEIQGPQIEFGYVPQNFDLGLIPYLTARENVLLPIMRKGSSNAYNIDDLLAYAGIGDVAHLNIRQLSGGQQQRVAICRSMIVKPDILFMDEPFANLDPTLKPDIIDLLMTFRQKYGLSLLLVTHDIETALLMTDRVFGVKKGYGKPTYKWLRTCGNNKKALKNDIINWMGTKL